MAFTTVLLFRKVIFPKNYMPRKDFNLLNGINLSNKNGKNTLALIATRYSYPEYFQC